jgi:phosphoglycerate dehydrogenase-like enzyme
VTNASGANDVAIAEWCILMILTLERNFPEMVALQRERRWERTLQFQSELRGKRVGIIGYGNIGRETARLCRAHGMEVWAMNRGPIRPRSDRYLVPGTGDPEAVMPSRTFLIDQMDDFLPHLDYLVLTTALNAGSEALLGERELSLLPSTAAVINPARAHLVDEQALVRSLRDGQIAGLAIDSHYREPMPPDDPFWTLPNTIVTPHISGSGGSPQYLPRVWELFATNLDRFRSGLPLLNMVPHADLAARLGS